MEAVTILGLTAATLTTFGFVPQIARTWKLKETKDISLWMYLVIWIGILLWLTYGSLIKDLPLILANAVSLTFVSVMLFFKFRYG